MRARRSEFIRCLLTVHRRLYSATTLFKRSRVVTRDPVRLACFSLSMARCINGLGASFSAETKPVSELARESVLLLNHEKKQLPNVCTGKWLQGSQSMQVVHRSLLIVSVAALH